VEEIAAACQVNGKHVEIILVPLARRSACGCPFEDQLVRFG
jgi:hypothetical protein